MPASVSLYRVEPGRTQPPTDTWSQGAPASAGRALRPAFEAAADEGGGTRGIVALVLAAQRGDRGAFEGLYREFAPVVHGVLLARVAKSEADDLAQEVFLAAWRRIESLRDGAAFGGWVCAIARHKAATYRGSPARRESPDVCSEQRTSGHDGSGHGTGPDGGGVDEAERVMNVIRSMPEAYRETLVLRLVAGLTGPQIASCIGMTPGSVRVNLCRGMEMLRERLGLPGDQR